LATPVVAPAKAKINAPPNHEVADLIANLDANPTQKYFLTLVWRHRHHRKGYAWMSQENLAWEMNVDTSTIERCFRWGKNLGIVGVNRVRTGKGKADQYNQYWLALDRLKTLQRTRKHPAPVQDASDKHPASVTGATDPEHPLPVQASTLHFEPEHPSFADGAPFILGSSTPHPCRDRFQGTSGSKVIQETRTSGGKLQEQNRNVKIAPPRMYPTRTPQIVEVLRVTVSLLNYHRYKHVVREGNPVPVETFAGLRKDFLKQTDALAIDFKQAVTLWEYIVRAFESFPNGEPLMLNYPEPEPAPTPKTPGPTAPPKAPPTPKPIPSFQGTRKWMLRAHFYDYATHCRWTPPGYPKARKAITKFLYDRYGVKTPDKLTEEQYAEAWHALEVGPPPRVN